MTNFGSSEAGKKGGRARAARLTKEQRAEIARKGAAARWSKSTEMAILRATHGSEDHPLNIHGIEIPCYVLENGTRVITHRGLQRSVGMAESGGAQRIVTNLRRYSDKGVDDKDLTSRIENPIKFQMANGAVAHGYEATVLADLCDVILAARKDGLLSKNQEHIGEQCEILVRGFARVGIIALVDEATGYQRSRERDELAKILEAFVAKEIQRYLKTFDLEFYELICELRDEPLDRVKKKPPYFGRITNNLVYERLAPGLLQKLQEVNPVVPETGRRKRPHTQHLTPDIGHPKLKEFLSGVISTMKFAKQIGMKWGEFLKVLDKTHPKYRPMPLFDHLEEED